MQFLYDLFPVFLFFLTFKFYDMYAATIVGIAATLVQTIVSRYWTGRWDRQQLITLSVFVVFGSMTLYFHNPIFIKWKPTVLFWIFAVVLLISQWVAKKPMMQQLMENVLKDQNLDNVPRSAWRQLNFCWVLFFTILGSINLYIAYHFSSDVWVNFKFYGITCALMLFSFMQAIFLMRYISDDTAVVRKDK